MNLTAREKDKLLISMAAMVARRRLERGVKLNYPEAVALISDFVVEGARDGRSVADLMEAGAHVVTRDQVMDGHRRDDPRRAGGSHLPRRRRSSSPCTIQFARPIQLGSRQMESAIRSSACRARVAGLARAALVLAGSDARRWRTRASSTPSRSPSGFKHPWTGLDHMLAMVAVGLWAGLNGGRALWAWPVAFVGVMVAGGALGIAGVAAARWWSPASSPR